MADVVRKRRTTKLLFRLGNVLVIVALAVFGGYYFSKYQNLKRNPPSADQVQKQETQRIVDKVAKLYGSLPKDEQPTVAKVQDKEKLKSQPFFDKAQNGDYTLIYANAKLAILYRDSTGQIINVSSVSIQSKPSVKIIGDAETRANVEKTVNSNFSNDVSVNGTGDAKGSYSGITVVDLTGQNGDVAKKLADGLKGQVGNLPSGEDKPAGVDILIIAGS
jgi:hypothetical protein